MAKPFSVSLFVSLRNLIHRIEPLDWTVGGLVKPQRLLISLPSLKVVPLSLIGGTMIMSFSPGRLRNSQNGTLLAESKVINLVNRRAELFKAG